MSLRHVLLPLVVSLTFLTGQTLPSEPPGSGGSKAPKANQAVRTDLYGDPLPPGAVARLGTIRLRHAGAEATFSADGKRLISCSSDGTFRVWDTASGKMVRHQRLGLAWTVPNYEPFIVDVALSPGGEVAAVSYEKTCYLYDTNTGRERGRLTSITSDVDCLWPTFSPDGKVLAAQEQDGESWLAVRLWDVARMTKCQTLAETSDCRVARVVFLADGKRLAGIVESTNLYLWDAATGKVIRKKDGLSKVDKQSLASSPDGKTLAVGGNSQGTVWLFDAATLKEKAVLKAPAKARATEIHQLAFSPDGKILAGAYSDDSWFGRPGYRGVLLWDLAGSRETRRLPGRYFSHLRFTPDGKTLAVYSSSASEIALWDVNSGRQLHHRPGHGNSVGVLATSPDGKVVASSDRQAELYLWDAANGKLLHALRGADYGTYACLFLPDSKRMISANDDGAFQVWDIASGKELHRFHIDYWPPGKPLELHALGASADGKRLAAVATGGVTPETTQLFIWDTATGERLKQRPYKAAEERVSDDPNDLTVTRIKAPAAFTADGERVSMWLGDRVGLEDVSTGSLLAVLPKGVDRPMVFSPDGRLVAATIVQPRQLRDPFLPTKDRKGLSLIETVSGEEVFRLEIGEFDHVAFTPDGGGLVVTDKKGLCVWDTATGERLRRMAWPDSIRDGRGEMRICSLITLPGGRPATGMADGDILIWDLAPSTWPVRKPLGELDLAKLDSLWSDLAGGARTAYCAIHMLTAAPAQAVPLLRDHLQPAVEVDAKRIEKLLADLDGDSFETRETATRELVGLGDRVEPILRHALRGRPPLEMRRRLQHILAEPRRPSAERLRTLRAIAVLERIGTPEARQLLEKLSYGVPARETQEARAALQRLKRR